MEMAEQCKSMILLYGDEGSARDPEVVNLLLDFVRSELRKLILDAKVHMQERDARALTLTLADIFANLHSPHERERILEYEARVKGASRVPKEDDGDGDVVADTLADGDEDGDESRDALAAVQKRKRSLCFDVVDSLLESVGLPELELAEDDDEPFRARKKFKASLNEKTLKMSKDEYLEFAKRREASFVAKKPAKFRTWIGLSDLGVTLNKKELLDALGLVAVERLREAVQIACRVAASSTKQRGDAKDSDKASSSLALDRTAIFQSAATVQPVHVAEAIRVMRHVARPPRLS